MIKPDLIQQFNEKKICLHDSANFSNYVNFTKHSDGWQVDLAEYFSTLKLSRWHGPFWSYGMYDFVFYSFVRTGDNNYTVSVWVKFNTRGDPKADKIFVIFNHKIHGSFGMPICIWSNMALNQNNMN